MSIIEIPITPRCWTEDFDHENGHYSNTCIECQSSFLGHKRRVVCKLCTELDRLKKANEMMAAACRYALATARALERYTFEDSDHGLLIAEMVQKLEDAALKANTAEVGE